MFSKLKQIKDLRDQAKVMQNALAVESISEEKKGVKITMNGNMEVISLTLNTELSKESLESAAKDCFNDCIKKTQRVMAKKMQEMGGLNGLMG
jgi:DNA-binding protein YbaB